MDKKTETNEGGESFVDIFQLDHSKYSDNESEEVQEVVSEGNGDVTDVTKQEEAEESVANEEESSTEVVEKQDEIEDVSEEDASTPDDNSEVTQLEGSEGGVQDIMQSLADNGVLLFDEDSEYEPNEKGLESLMAHTIKEKTENAFLEMKSSLPEEASKLLDVLSKGGTVEDYNSLTKQVDFSKVNTNNERNQEYLVEDYMKLQGFDDLEIRERLEDLTQAGLLEKEALLAKGKLSKNQKEVNQEYLAKMEQEQKQNQERAQEEANAFRDEVFSITEIAGFSVSPAKAKKLYDFITAPGKDGLTAFQKADSKENRMLYAMMAMDGFDKSKLSKQEASRQTIKLKKKLNNYQDSNASPKGSAVRRGTGGSSGGSIPWNM